jgi:hypothetical protein
MVVCQTLYRRLALKMVPMESEVAGLANEHAVYSMSLYSIHPQNAQSESCRFVAFVIKLLTTTECKERAKEPNDVLTYAADDHRDARE